MPNAEKNIGIPPSRPKINAAPKYPAFSFSLPHKPATVKNKSDGKIEPNEPIILLKEIALTRFLSSGKQAELSPDKEYQERYIRCSTKDMQ